MKIILVSDTRTGSTLVYQTLIDIYGVDNVLKLHLDGIHNNITISNNKLKINKITSHHSISNTININSFLNNDIKFIFTTRDKYDQFLSGIRVKNSLKSTTDITLEMVNDHLNNVIDYRINNNQQFGFDRMVGLHHAFIYFIKLFNNIITNEISNALLLPYHRFNNNFDYLFSELESYLNDSYTEELKLKISTNRGRSKNLEISNTMNSFNNFDKKTHIHGLHVSTNDYSSEDLIKSEIYLKVKESIDLKMKDVDFRILFRKYQEFNGVSYPEKKILVFGDSHTDVFRFISIKQNNILFDVILVGGATAQGSVNPMSKTNALNIFREKINKYDLSEYEKVIIMLGEVDCGFVIWYRSQKHNIPMNDQLKISTDNLLKFIKSDVENYFDNNQIIICGSILPTIKDGVVFGDLANLRREVKATQKEKTELTLNYNNILCKICEENNYRYIDITKETISENGLIKNDFLNKVKTEQHLPNEKIWNIWYNKINKIYD